MKFILFDLEGTLIDSKKLQVKVLQKVFNQFGVDTQNIDMVSLIGPPLIITFTKYFGQDCAQNAMDYYVQTFNNIEISNIYVNPEIKVALPILKDLGFKLITTSLQVVEIVERELKYLGIYDYFDFVIGDDKLRPYTSKTDLVSRLIKDKKLDTNQMFLVGDTEFDKICAEKNGIKFVGVGWGYGLKDEKDCVKCAKELINKVSC